MISAFLVTTAFGGHLQPVSPYRVFKLLLSVASLMKRAATNLRICRAVHFSLSNGRDVIATFYKLDFMSLSGI